MSVKTEIHRALCQVSFLDRIDRAGLILRIVGELQKRRDEILSGLQPEKCFWIDTLIAATSSALLEIAAMDEIEYLRLLAEFDRLLETLDALERNLDRPTIH